MRENVYNIVEGGQGRFPPDATWKALASKTPEQIREYARRSKEVMRKKYGGVQSPKNKVWTHSEENKKRLREHAKLTLTPEAIAKKKETLAKIGHQQGEKNSQHGTMWITNGTENQKIQKESPIPLGWQKGRVIKIGMRN